MNKILELINQGENVSVEFKEQEVHADSVSKEIVAMLNTSGGNILIGVSDDGIIKGVDASKDWDQWVSNIARNNIIPAAQITLELFSIDEKYIVLVEVPKGKDKPYQTNKNQFLIRVGSTNRIATQQEIQRLFQNSGFFHFDSVAVEKSNIKDIDLNRLSQYFENYSIDINHENNLEQLLRNIDIIDSDSEKLTIAGNLVFGLRPEKFMPNAGLTIASFKGNELSEDLLHYQKIDGTLPNQVDQALNTIKSIVSTASYIEGLKRVNLYESYSDKLWREILVNAVVHRDYSITGSRIRILKYDDRIEFRSPGRLANTVNLEKIKFGVSYSRNPVIVKFMENLRYIDQLGRGIPLVIKEISQKGGKIDFQEIGEEFVVIVYFPKV